MMNQDNMAAPIKIQALAAALIVSIGWLCIQPGAVLGAVSAAAVVSAVEGKAEVSGKEPGEQVPLEKGMRIEPWQTVATDEKGKLMLRWEDGLVASLGGFSSALLSVAADRAREAQNIQVLDGLARVASQKATGSDASAFFVTTPTASIRPEQPGRPVDFIVEVYEPDRTVVTVIAGSVRISKVEGEQPREEIVSACNTVYIEQEKATFDRVSLSPEDLRKLAAQATIQGTMEEPVEHCAHAPSVPPAARREAAPQYWAVPEYEYIDEGVMYEYPWDDIQVIHTPTYRDRVVCFVPGYGRFIIPYALGYALDPVIWQVYVRYAFIDRALHYHRIYYDDVIHQRKALYNALYLAAVSGHHRLWWDTRRQLRHLEFQSRWAGARIRDLERRVSALEIDRQRFATRVPAHVNLAHLVANSFNSSTNRNIINRFENRVQGRFTDERRLAAATGRELMDFRSKISREQDPQRRLELRNRFAQVRDQLDKGKIPVPANQAEVKRLAEQISKAGGSADRTRLQEQLVGRLAQRGSRAATEQVLNPERLAPLKQGLAAFPDARKRAELEKRFTQLEQSVARRTQVEATGPDQEQELRRLRDRFAREQDAGKKEQLLKQLQQLGSTRRQGTQLRQSFQERQQIRPPVVGGRDVVRPEDQRRALDEQRRKNAELKLQQQVQQGKAREQQQQLFQQQRAREQQQLQQDRLQQQQKQRAKEQQQLEQQRVREQQQRVQQLQQQRAKEHQPLQQRAREQQQRALEQVQRQQQQRQQSSRSLQQAIPQQWQQPSMSLRQAAPRQSPQPSRALQQVVPKQPQSIPRQSSLPSGQQRGKGAQVQMPPGLNIR